ncbi:hypothetical protein FOA52_000365 [Chlamydomonas sp. UWO 241]|nr:hypothetical protein FOA52_000365 [Chlamydomonas sp. UWO 241]
MADVMAAYWAGVAAAPPPSAEEERQVMDAVRLHATPLPPELAVMAGSPTISTASVKRSAKMTQPGKAPGPDGLPAELWSSFQPELAPMLASLYTAIGTTGQSPPGYLDGVIRCLPKPGEAADPANYRPITLLNTDYRLMGKVLAARLAPLLSRSIPPEETAFLPGRLIGDNLAMLQLLPAWLRLCGEQHGLPATATLACLDFRKAYDTVSRPFLLAVMEAVGAGPGLIGWAKTVLLDTRAAAMVNGFTSASYRSYAGVRQGCPLAPVLYLFIAWALNAWLRTCPVVGLVPAGWEGRRLLGDQYADDTHVLLRSRSPEDAQCFLRHMAVFARASGQHLNEKSVVIAHMIADSQSGAIAAVVATGLCPAALGDATTLGTAVAARTGVSVQAALMLMAAIPELCRAGAMAGGGDATADARDATREVVDSLGWQAPADGMSAPISLADHPALRVGRVTRQLLAPSRRMRAGWQGEFVDSAFEGDAAGPADAAERVVEVAALARAMKGLWRVLWVNQSKETYWRLAAHGVRYAGGHDVAPPSGGHCPCGWAPSPAAPGAAQALQAREHYFWSCPVAASVAAEIRLGLGLPVADGPSRADVWLLHPPPAAVVASGLHAGAWAVVCAAAVDAMERVGRIHLP